MNKIDMKAYQEIIKEGLSMIPMDTIRQPILWYTDLHLQPRKEIENERVLAFILEAIKQVKPALIVNTGDTFHTKDQVYTSVLKQYQNYLEEYTQFAKVIQLVGNHDWGKLYVSHSLEQYQNIRNVVNVGDVYRESHMAFAGYSRDKERFGRQMKECLGARDLFGHLDVNGFQLGSAWEEVHAYSDIEDFGVFQNVFSGHYHLAQQKLIQMAKKVIMDKLSERMNTAGIIIPEETRFTYLGTSATTSWGEADQHKRIGIIDGETGEFYDLPTGMTFHKRLFVDPTDPVPVLPEDELARGVDFKVVLNGTKAQVKEKEKELPKEMSSKVAFNITQDKSDRISISLDAGTETALRKVLYNKLSGDFKIEVTDENILIVSKDIKLDINRVIERAFKYAEEAKQTVA